MGGSSNTPTIQREKVTETANRDPWAPSQEYLKTGLVRSEDAYQRALQQGWPEFQTFTEFDPLQLESFDRISARARAGSPQVPAAQAFNLEAIGGIANPAIEQLLSTARGDFLTGETNPYTQTLIDEILGNVAGQASASGRLGSGYATGAATTAVAPFLFGEYGRERAHQETARARLADVYQQDLLNRQFAAGQAPTMAAMDYVDPFMLEGVGKEKRAQADLELSQKIQEFDFLRKREELALNAFLGRVGAIGGQGFSQVTEKDVPIIGPPQESSFDKALRVAGTAAQIAGAVGFCDHRLKDNIEDLPDGALDNVLKLKPKTYNYRPEYGFDPTPTKGFLAHEVQEVLPEAVTGIKDGELPQLIDVISILTTVTKALQELAVKVNGLEATVQEIKHGS